MFEVHVTSQQVMRRGLAPGSTCFDAENMHTQSSFELVKKNLVLEMEILDCVQSQLFICFFLRKKLFFSDVGTNRWKTKRFRSFSELSVGASLVVLSSGMFS